MNWMTWLVTYLVIGGMWGIWLVWDQKDAPARRLRVAFFCLFLWPVSAFCALVLLADHIRTSGRR